MLQNIGLLEIIIIAAVVIMLFGASRLPKFAKGVVDAQEEFKKGYDEGGKQKKKTDKK